MKIDSSGSFAKTPFLDESFSLSFFEQKEAMQGAPALTGMDRRFQNRTPGSTPGCSFYLTDSSGRKRGWQGRRLSRT
jgi:hypothetical protein